MGGVPSTPLLGSTARSQGTAEDLIRAFVDEKSFPLECDYWLKLLELPLDLHWPPDRVLQACQLFARNNCRTRHLAKLLVHLSWCLQDSVCGSDVTSPALLRALNALFLLSVFLKYLIENAKSGNFEELHLLIDESEPLPDNFSKGEDVKILIMSNVLNFIARCNISPGSYLLHHELLYFLLIAMSTQLLYGPSPEPNEMHPFIHAIMIQESSLIESVVQKLLLNYIIRPKIPINSIILPQGSQPGVLWRVRQAAANLMMLPFNYFASSLFEASRSPLAEISLNTLLILSHCRKCNSVEYAKEESNNILSDSLPKDGSYFSENPFSKAVSNIQDVEINRSDIKWTAWDTLPLRLPFASLFDTFGMCLADENSVLLLYSLLHGNTYFLEYVLVRTDLDTLLVPMLETLYNAARRTSQHIYMVLVPLLILSQDSSFNANIHKLMLPSVPWYRERLLHQISIGSLMIIILIRIAKYNLSKLKDIYLHTNCLAILANMAPYANRLSAYASQELISLFDKLARKYTKLAEVKNDMLCREEDDIRGDCLQEDPSTELHVYADFLRLVMEILNSILTYALPRNPEVVYAVMHRQEVFDPFKNHPRFRELLENIYSVIGFFNCRIDFQKVNGEWSAEKVLQVIIDICRSWRGEGMKMFTLLRFTYEQESNPEEFFVPYIWQLTLSQSGLTFNRSSINLFPVPIEEDMDNGFEMEKVQTLSTKNTEHGL